MTAHYDDPEFSYQGYWRDRKYEHQSEVTALKSLLGQNRFSISADIGGGFGRLIPTLLLYSSRVYLIEPSVKQRSLAKRLLPFDPRVTVIPGSAHKTSLSTSSVDLVTLIRVAHHLPDLHPCLQEAFRIIRPGGLLVFEFANSANFKSRLTSLLSGQSLPFSPIDLRSPRSIRAKTIPFVNHHPNSVLKLLKNHGFQVNTILSVSNLRIPWVKEIIPLSILNILESVLQPLLSRLWFGPSIFIKATKLDTPTIL